MCIEGGEVAGCSGTSKGLTLEFTVAVGEVTSGGSAASEGVPVGNHGEIHSSPEEWEDKFDSLSLEISVGSL